LIEREEISLESRISILCTLNEALEDATLAALVGGFIVIAHAILVLKDLGVNNIVKGLMRLILKTCFNEIVLLELEFALSSQGLIVKLLSNNIVFRVKLDISFEVVTIHLFLLGEASEEVGVVLSPSLTLSL
jgi:hypothetical protein